MKVQILNNNKINYTQKQNKNTNSTNALKGNNSQARLASYPAGYYISFGTRSVKEMYDTYSDTLMPTTVKNYIEDRKIALSDSDFERLMAQPKLFQIQQEAFRDLADCKTVEDVRKAFPNERCLKNIKSIKDVPTKGGGVFNLISKKLAQGEKVFNEDYINEDLSVFIAKKLFYHCTSMTDLKQEVENLTVDEEVKNKIHNSTSTWHSNTFAPLGIDVPDGVKYGKALLYSQDREYSNALSTALTRAWENLSSEEVTEKVDKLLQGSKKEKLTMMDAWNKCITIRKKMSDFLFENYDNPKYSSFDSETADENIEDVFSKGNISLKMKKLMSDFWNNNPDLKHELGAQIISSRKTYEEKFAQGEEAFKQYEENIIETSNLIKAQLKEEKTRAHDFPLAKKLIQTVAQKTNKMYIVTPQTIEDFYNLLLANMTNGQLKIYEDRLLGDESDSNYSELNKKFNANYPPKDAIIKTRSSLEYTNLINAQILAILGGDLKREKISTSDLFDCMTDKQKLNELINKTQAEKPSSNYADYSELKQPLTQKEKAQVREALTKYLPKEISSDTDMLDMILTTQGKYLLNINSANKSLRTATLLLALQEIDKLTGSTTTEDFIKKTKEEESQQEKIDLLKTINWSSFNINSWDE